MNIRTASLSDTHAIAKLHAESWRFAYRGALSDEYLAGDIIADRTALWTSRLMSPPANQQVVIAHDGNALFGFACAYTNEDMRWGSLLDNLHVHQDAHRRGIGSQLLESVAGYCMKASANAGLYLWVLQNNNGAQKFYSCHGAQNVGTDTWNAPGGTQVPRFRFAWTSSAMHLIRMRGAV